VLRSGTPKSYVKTAESGNKRRHLRRLRHADLRPRRSALPRVDRLADVPRAEKG
jgi:hypothetical protein